MSSDGKSVASGSANGLRESLTVNILHFWCKPVNFGANNTWQVTSVAVSSDGKSVASGSADGTACIWDAATGKVYSYTLVIYD